MMHTLRERSRKVEPQKGQWIEGMEPSLVLCKQGVTGSIPVSSTNPTNTRPFRHEHYDARCLKGFKTATSKCAKSRSFRVATVRP